MKKGELAREWPDYWLTHNISEDELTRIAKEAGNVEEARKIREDEDWWTDQENEDLENWPRGYSYYASGEISRDEFRRILESAMSISRIYPGQTADIILEEENWWRDEFAETGMNEAQSMILDNLGYLHDRLDLEDILGDLRKKAVSIHPSNELNWPGTTEETCYLFRDGSSILTYLEGGYLTWSYGRVRESINHTKSQKPEKSLSRIETLSNKLEEAGIETDIWQGNNRLRNYLTLPPEWINHDDWPMVRIQSYFDYNTREDMEQARQPHDGSMFDQEFERLKIFVNSGRSDINQVIGNGLKTRIREAMISQGLLEPSVHENTMVIHDLAGKGRFEEKPNNPTPGGMKP